MISCICLLHCMLPSPCCMHGSLVFGCVLLWKSVLCKLRIVLLMPRHQLQAGYVPDSNSHKKMLSMQWLKIKVS